MTNYPIDNLAIYDLEVYKNFFLMGVKLPDGTVIQEETLEGCQLLLGELRKHGYNLAGFNSLGYDDLVLTVFLQTGSEFEAYITSSNIIQENIPRHMMENAIGSIDLKQLVTGRISLKAVGTRLYYDHLEELPINPHVELSEVQKQVIRGYNIKDLDITELLALEMKDELELRSAMSNEYGLDLRSKGGAPIAEAVLGEEIKKITGKSFKQLKDESWSILGGGVIVEPPTWWSKMLSQAVEGSWLRYTMFDQAPRLNVTIPLDEKGKLIKGALDSTLYLDDNFYAMGLGGVHSVDGPGAIIPKEDEFLCVADVASLYPYSILLQKCFPRHVKVAMEKIYGGLLTSRMEAKRSGRKQEANSKKLILNSSYGHFSNPYSVLFDPQQTARVCVYGQLAFVTLVAMLADIGVHAKSCNTDGGLFLGKRQNHEVMIQVASWWEGLTGYKLEYDYSKAYHIMDVNNFIMVNDDG